MNKHDSKWWLIRTTLTAAVIFIVYAIAFNINLVLEARLARNRIFNANYSELIAAGRDMIEQQRTHGNLKSAKTTPPEIRRLNPIEENGICTTSNVYVRIHAFPRVGFMVLAEGIDASFVTSQWPNATMLTNGLWYCR